MVTADDIKSKLQQSEELQPTYLQITDTSDGCGGKFEAIIVSATFNGMGLLDRQRKVNEVIKEEMDQIHAFSMKCWTPDQYEKKMGGAPPTHSADPAAPPPRRFPEHWGEPPLMQTKDLRELPGGYGMGSGTLKAWITEKMAADAAAAGSS